MPRCAPLLLILLTLPAHAASFDCKAAQTPREKAICASPELSALDDKLARAYAAARAQLTPASAALVQADQREWLTWLDRVCPPNSPATDTVAACLKEHYGSRVGQLTTGVQRIDGTVFYTRAHFVFVPGKPPAQDQAAIDPGFGYGEFSWPQVDAPDPTHAVFNTAATAAAQMLEGVAPNGKASSLDNAVDATGDIYGAFTLSAANDHLIDVDFINSSYGWGAAHPLTTQSSFLWLVDPHHTLSADDVLRPGTDWQTKLIDPTLAKLQHGSQPGEIWTGEDLRKGVTQGIKDPTAWDLSTKGLTITFGQYAVGPYSSGMPSVTFSWGELAPYLNPAFNPAILPPPRPQGTSD